MAVYVDDMAAKYGRLKMFHMLADSTEELLEMARRIGVQEKWIEDRGTPREHFDIALAKRRLAVAAGAVEITWRQAAAMQHRRIVTGFLGSPESAVDWLRANLRARP